MAKLFPIAILAALAAGCGRSSSCPDIVDHVAHVMKLDPSPAQRAETIARCEKVPAEARACIRDADTPAALAACDE